MLMRSTWMFCWCLTQKLLMFCCNRMNVSVQINTSSFAAHESVWIYRKYWNERGCTGSLSCHFSDMDSTRILLLVHPHSFSTDSEYWYTEIHVLMQSLYIFVHPLMPSMYWWYSERTEIHEITFRQLEFSDMPCMYWWLTSSVLLNSELTNPSATIHSNWH